MVSFSTRTEGDIKMSSYAYEISNIYNIIKFIHPKLIDFFLILLITSISPNSKSVAQREII